MSGYGAGIGSEVNSFGAGAGFYSKAASPRVGNTGRVYAIEVQKDLVKKLESEIKTWGSSNVECIWGDIEKHGGTKIADKSIDAIICVLPYGTTNCKWDSVLDLNKLWEQYKRVLTDNGVVILFAQTPFDKVLGCSNLEWLKSENSFTCRCLRAMAVYAWNCENVRARNQFLHR